MFTLLYKLKAKNNSSLKQSGANKKQNQNKDLDTERKHSEERQMMQEALYANQMYIADGIRRLVVEIIDDLEISGEQFITESLKTQLPKIYRDEDKPSDYKLSTILQEAQNVLKEDRKQLAIDASNRFDKCKEDMTFIDADEGDIIQRGYAIFAAMSTARHIKQKMDVIENELKNDFSEDSLSMYNHLKQTHSDLFVTLNDDCKKLQDLVESHFPNGKKKNQWLSNLQELRMAMEQTFNKENDRNLNAVSRM
jgi:hypothetical protein